MKHYLKITQFKKNIFSGSLTAGINILLLLISYPIYLGILGAEVYGIWAAISVVVLFSDFGNLGINNAIIKFTAAEWGRRNKVGITEYLTTSIMVMMIPAVFIIAILILSKYYIITFLNLPYHFHESLASLIPLMGFLSISLFYSHIFKGALMGLGRIDFANYIFLLGSIIKVFSIITFLYFNLGIWALYWGSLLNSFFLIFIFCYIIIFKFDIKIISLNGLKKDKLLNLIKFGMNIVGSKLVNMTLLPFIKIVIIKYIGLSEVTYFEIAWKGAYHLRNLFEKGILAIMPKISELYSAEKIKNLIKVKETHNKGLKFSIIFGVSTFLIFFLIADFVLDIWLQKEYNISISIVFKYLLVAWGFSLLFLPAYYTLMGVGQVKYCMHEAIIKAIINLLIISILLLFNYLTLANLAFSLTISIIVSHLYIGYFYYKLINAV